MKLNLFYTNRAKCLLKFLNKKNGDIKSLYLNKVLSSGVEKNELGIFLRYYKNQYPNYCVNDILNNSFYYNSLSGFEFSVNDVHQSYEDYTNKMEFYDDCFLFTYKIETEIKKVITTEQVVFLLSFGFCESCLEDDRCAFERYFKLRFYTKGDCDVVDLSNLKNHTKTMVICKILEKEK